MPELKKQLSDYAQPKLAQAAFVQSVIAVEHAVGSVLCHDITRIILGQEKGVAFKKGHIVREQDIQQLLKIGKEHLYVLSPQKGWVHEEEAAMRMATAAMGLNISLSAPQEGKVTMFATQQGLLQVDIQALSAINSLGSIAFASLHSMQEVQQGQAFAGVRVIPLIVEESKVQAVENICIENICVENICVENIYSDTKNNNNSKHKQNIFNILPFKKNKVGIVVTGSEIYHGRIKDAFAPIVQNKFERLGSYISSVSYSSDDINQTRDEILKKIHEDNADMVVVTGGMSVDPDDKTPAAIKASGAKIIFYGAPIFPGAMFLLALMPSPRGAIPILGLPGCVMYHKTSIFDLVVPRLLAGLEVTNQDITALGHGGFCASCAECRYPLCSFGK